MIPRWSKVRVSTFRKVSRDQHGYSCEEREFLVATDETNMEKIHGLFTGSEGTKHCIEEVQNLVTSPCSCGDNLELIGVTGGKVVLGCNCCGNTYIAEGLKETKDLLIAL